MKVMKQIYYQLPPRLRSLAASGYGYYLRAWRYGGSTERIVKEALARETCAPEKWQEWQEEQLTMLLHRAATQVPYYRKYWQERRRQGDAASWEVLSNWPVLTKEPLRADPQAFIADDHSDQLFKLDTSGSTGTPITTWRNRKTMQNWYALFEARWRRWYGVTFDDRWAILGGKIVTPISQEQPPFWVWNQGLNQLYMSTFHLKADNISAYLDALRKHHIVYLYGYASSLHVLASMALEQGLEVPQMRVAISNAEPLLPHQRESIGKAFRCPVRNTYGMAEAVVAASECEHSSMHLWPEVGVVEVFADDTDELVEPGEVGRLICTGLLNNDMPLIRYQVGDRGALASENSCECGRTLPKLERLEGRLNDNLITADGRRVFSIGYLYYGLPIKEAQIIQESVGHVVIKVVPAEGYSALDTEVITKRLHERVGSTVADVQLVDSIPRTSSGKLQAVINRVTSS